MEDGVSDDLERAVQVAWAAQDRSDWLGAIDLWKAVLRIDPTFVPAYWMAGMLLLQNGQVEEAEQHLSKGVTLDPENIPMAVNHAKAATLLNHWPEAIRRWISVSRRAPDAKEVIDGLAEAEMQMQMYRICGMPGVGPTDKDWKRFLARRVTSDDTELFMQFQSIGDNCEFGLVQRHFLAEPVSLLRWNTINIEALTIGVERGFDGMGDPENTTLFVGQNEEYALSDTRFGTAMHTFLKKHEVQEDPDELYTKMCKRQAYLRRQFIEDLEYSDQIFVFKSILKISLDKAMALHAAMERYGRNYLLFVIEADEVRRAGSVEEVAPRLFVCAIERFSRPGDGWDNLYFDTWRALCKEVWKRVLKYEGLKGLVNRVSKGMIH